MQGLKNVETVQEVVLELATRRPAKLLHLNDLFVLLIFLKKKLQKKKKKPVFY